MPSEPPKRTRPLPDHAWSAELVAFFDAEEAALDAGRIDEAVALNVAAWAPHAGEPVKALVAEMQRRAFELQVDVELEPLPIEPPLAERLRAVRVPISVAYGDLDFEDFAAVGNQVAWCFDAP